MRCPSCGTLVDDKLNRCPACHASLPPEENTLDEGVSWCKSCGSPIPNGMDACPVCGMPVEGAFDEDVPEEPPSSDESASSLKAAPLNSAIPAVPRDGTDASFEATRPMRRKMLLVAAATAVLLVGGTTLLITRPWNPNAYDQRAKEEADTSMAGFPGEVSHLSSQDFIEDIKHQEYALQIEKTLTAYRDRLGRLALGSSASFQKLKDYINNNDVVSLEQGVKESQALKESLERETARVAGLIIEDDAVDEQRRSLMVLSSYLGEELSILVNTWVTVSHATSLKDASLDAQTVMARPLDGYVLDEWHSLFVNAYVSEHS